MVNKTEGKPNPKVIVEHCYDLIKGLAEGGSIKSEDVAAIAELTTELANRLKIEESGE